MLTLDAAVPPSLDLGVDLFVEVGHCARAHPRPPQSFGDVLHPTHRNARQIHLDQRLLDRALAAAVPVDDRRLKGLVRSPPTLALEDRRDWGLNHLSVLFERRVREYREIGGMPTLMGSGSAALSSHF